MLPLFSSRTNSAILRFPFSTRSTARSACCLSPRFRQCKGGVDEQLPAGKPSTTPPSSSSSSRTSRNSSWPPRWCRLLHEWSARRQRLAVDRVGHAVNLRRRQRRPGLGEIGRGCAQRRYRRKRQRHERERAVVEPHGRRRRRRRLLHHVGHEMVLPVASTAGPAEVQRVEMKPLPFGHPTGRASDAGGG